jgi:hypothetical protein
MNLSEAFLRRNKLSNHHSLYVSRALDRDIANAIGEMSPNRLTELTRPVPRKQRDKFADDAVLPREMPAQVAIVLDPPGSGKTMLATQFALSAGSSLCVARTADDPEVHELARQLELLGADDHGLGLMLEIDKPFVYIIDGLDESDTQEKRSDIVHLLRSLAELNRWASHRGLRAFPIFMILTARKDSWERWISVFEGRSAIRFRDRLRSFSEDELELAIANYSSAYQYSFARPIPTSAGEVLSVPFNLRLLSETLEYQGDDVPAEHILGKHVLTFYFDWLTPRFSRQIAHLSDDSFIGALCDLALAAARAPHGRVDETTAAGILAAEYLTSPDVASDFLELLVQ